jgi:hypothetical protein
VLEIVSCAAPHITYYINTISPQTLLSQLLSIDLSEPCPQAGACLLSSTRNIWGLAADSENVWLFTLDYLEKKSYWFDRLKGGHYCLPGWMPFNSYIFTENVKRLDSIDLILTWSLTSLEYWSSQEKKKRKARTHDDGIFIWVISLARHTDPNP